MYRTLKFILLLTIIPACSDSSSIEAPRTRTQNADANLTRPQVNVEQLEILSLTNATISEGNRLKVLVTSYTTGDVDYVKYTACLKEDKSVCSSGKSTTNQIILPALAADGKIVFEAAPCVDPGRSLTGNECGKSKSDEFSQPKVSNYEFVRLSSLRNQKINSIISYGKRVKDIAENYQKDVQQCIDKENDYKDLMAKRQMILGFIALGDSLIGQSLTGKSDTTKNGVTGLLSGLLPQGSTPVNNNAQAAMNQISTGTQAMEKSGSYYDFTKDLFTSVGLYSVKPVNAIQTVGEVVLNLFTADKAVKPNCFAEENAKREMEVIKNDVTRLKQEVTDINAEIKAMAGEQ